MNCPACGCGDLRRDYAPARSYALMLLGVGMLAAGRFLRPELVLYPQELKKLVAVGVAVLLFGLFDSLRHGNRYCAACGFRLRVKPGRGGWLPRLDLAGWAREAGSLPGEESRPGSRYIRGMRAQPGSASGRDEDDEELDPNTPLEPIIACLKFKDSRMRRDAAKTLRKLTGQDLGEDHAAWSAWYRENRGAGRGGNGSADAESGARE